MGCSKMVSRVRLRKFLFSGITSCLSVRRKDSQGCTADVKDTPPSPKEKPDDLIGPDIDPVRDHDDLRAEIRAQLYMERWVGIDSDMSADEDFNKLLNDLIIVRRAQLYMERRPDSSSSEEELDVSYYEDWVESSDDREEMNQELSSEVGWKHG